MSPISVTEHFTGIYLDVSTSIGKLNGFHDSRRVGYQKFLGIPGFEMLILLHASHLRSSGFNIV